MTKLNKAINVGILAISAIVFVGCNGGGGGGGASRPNVDCRLASNWQHPTCLNRTGGPFGNRGSLVAGTYRQGITPEGRVILTEVRNPIALASICNDTNSAGGYASGGLRNRNYRRSSYADDGYSDGYYGDGYSPVGLRGGRFNNVCMVTPLRAELSFQTAGNAGAFKFYFNGTDSGVQYDGSARRIPGGFQIITNEGLVVTGIYEGVTVRVNLEAEGVLIATGTMAPAPM